MARASGVKLMQPRLKNAMERQVFPTNNATMIKTE